MLSSRLFFSLTDIRHDVYTQELFEKTCVDRSLVLETRIPAVVSDRLASCRDARDSDGENQSIITKVLLERKYPTEGLIVLRFGERGSLAFHTDPPYQWDLQGLS